MRVSSGPALLPGLLAIVAGFLLVTSLPAYGGIGINLLFFAANRGVPQEGRFLYNVVGFYALAMAILLIALGFLLLTEFTSWRFRYKPGLTLMVAPLLFVLTLIHLAAFWGLVQIRNVELKELFVDSSVHYAALALISLGLYFAVHWRVNREQ
jgi:hypothetical protein